MRWMASRTAVSFLARRRGPPMAVVARTAERGQRTHPRYDASSPCGRGCHRLDDGVDAFAPGRRSAGLPSTCRKACRKKSSSTCCWPILRSSSATRRCAPASSSSPVSPASYMPPGPPPPLLACAGGPARATPPAHPCEPCPATRTKAGPEAADPAPPTATLSPAARRASAASFNAVGYSRCFTSVPLLGKLSPIFRVSLLGCTYRAIALFWCRNPVPNRRMIYGYARVSTDGPSVEAEVASLRRRRQSVPRSGKLRRARTRQLPRRLWRATAMAARFT